MFDIDPIKLLERLKKRYEEKHDFNCICQCYDYTVCKYEEHTVNVWTSGTKIKFLGDDDESCAEIKRQYCPICGHSLSDEYDPYWEIKSNDERVI